MKPLSSSTFIILCFLFFASSCSIEKRLYNRGYSVQWKKGHASISESKKEIREQTQLENIELATEKITVESVQIPDRADSIILFTQNDIISTTDIELPELNAEDAQKSAAVSESKHQNYLKQKSVQRVGLVGRVVLILLVISLFSVLGFIFIILSFLDPILLGTILTVIGIVLLVSALLLFVFFILRGFGLISRRY